ncbi:MAG: MmcQ/YjbR family DNA-binding protein [Chloroflexota bacterium]
MLPEPCEHLRQLCLGLPDVTERLSHGEPTWFIRGKKTFVSCSTYHHDDRLSFVCAAPDGAQEMLVAAEPGRFYRPPYVGGRGWLGVYLDVPVDWDEIAELVLDAYCQVAPRRLADEARSASALGSLNPGRE